MAIKGEENDFHGEDVNDDDDKDSYGTYNGYNDDGGYDDDDDDGDVDEKKTNYVKVDGEKVQNNNSRRNGISKEGNKRGDK